MFTFPSSPPSEVRRLAVLGDHQVPYHDKETGKAVLAFLRDFQPDVLALNGDIADFTSLSRFRLTLKEREGLERERQELRALLWSYRDALPNATIVYIAGNHEERLTDYLTDHAPELAFLKQDELSLERFAGLDKLNIQLLRPYGAAYEWHGLIVTHGTIVRDNAAKANLIAEGSSGISNHTHRMSSYYKRDRSGEHAWYENGCLCILDGESGPPPAHYGARNWQQGITVAYAVSRHWTVYQIPIVAHRFIWNGRVYDGNQ